MTPIAVVTAPERRCKPCRAGSSGADSSLCGPIWRVSHFLPPASYNNELLCSKTIPEQSPSQGKLPNVS